MLLFPAALIVGAHLVLAADDVPRLDVESTCRGAQPLSAEDKTPYRTCMNEQMQARTRLEQQWGQLPANAKGRCIQESTLGGSPSYVELLTCLQLAKTTDLDKPSPPLEAVTPPSLK